MSDGIPVNSITGSTVAITDKLLTFNSSATAAPTVQQFINQTSQKLTAQTTLSSDDTIMVNHGGTVYKGTLADIVKAVTQATVQAGSALPVSGNAVNVALAELNINTTTPTFNVNFYQGSGSYTLRYIKKQSIGEINIYMGSLKFDEDVSGGNIIFNIDGLSLSKNDRIEGKWYINNSGLEGIMPSYTNTSLWLQKGYSTSPNTRLSGDEVAGKIMYFTILSTKAEIVTTQSED